MTMTTAREHFTATGKLTKATRPPHDFEIGRLMGSWRLSSDGCWCDISDKGTLNTHWLTVGTFENEGGTKAFRLTVGPLSFVLGWV